MIAIDGKGGVGKTTISRQLAELLGAEIIHTDDFTPFDQYAFDGADAIVTHVFKPINRGARTLSYDRLRVWPGEPARVENQSVTDIMILEGCGSSCAKFRPYLSYTILVTLGDEERGRRMVARDVMESGRSLEENVRIGKLWYDQERVYFAHDNPTRRADIVIENDTSIDAHATLRQLRAETRQSADALQPRFDAER